MGFGKKKDPETNRTIDLDATYKKIIRPAVEAAGCKCIRADEIVESGIIDRSMYALLYYADVVIADISTYNPNAIYELGVRHTMRPFSTIIIKEDESKIPFDIGHDRIISYKHLGNEISDSEAKIFMPKLRELIKRVLENPQVDSPFYTFIHEVKKPEVSEDEIQSIIGELKDNEETIYALTEKAKAMMDKNDFLSAEKLWKKLSEKVENEIYYTQQQALCRYKSQSPSKKRALIDALSIINKIENQTDTETLGITGAIYKRLWEEEKEEVSYLKSAIEAYKKGWNLYKDYYTGENYATCMLIQASITDGDIKTHSNVEAKLTFEEIISIIMNTLEGEEHEEIMWKYATLSNSYLGLGQVEDANTYESLFRKENPSELQIKTFESTKSLYINIMDNNNVEIQ